jgi:hypothetical protein
VLGSMPRSSRVSMSPISGSNCLIGTHAIAANDQDSVPVPSRRLIDMGL